MRDLPDDPTHPPDPIPPEGLARPDGWVTLEGEAIPEGHTTPGDAPVSAAIPDGSPVPDPAASTPPQASRRPARKAAARPPNTDAGVPPRADAAAVSETPAPKPRPATPPRRRPAVAEAVATPAALRSAPMPAVNPAPARTGSRGTAAVPAPTAPAPPAPALLVEDLSFSYGARKILDAVGFTVRRGAFTALLGPNGAGKTTLFSLLTRLFDAPTGRISILGRDLGTAGPAALAPLGVVFQSETLDQDLTVRQNLLYFAGLHGLRRAAAEARIAEELAAIGMSEGIDRRVRDLNGGHRRRVEIARALLHRPALLLLDEATVGLDVPTRKAIVARVHALARDTGIGVLWTTHLIDEVEADDDLLVLHRGRIVAAGRAEAVTATAGADSLADAFDRLTGASSAPEPTP